MRNGIRLLMGAFCVLAAGSALAVSAGADDNGLVPESELPVLDPEMDVAISQLEPTARENWPDDFAGLWITGEDPGTDTISVAFDDDAQEHVSTLAMGFSHPEMLVAVDVDQSLNQLEAIQGEMIADRELSRKGELNVPDVPPAGYDLDIDVKSNDVVVIAEDMTPELRSWFHERYGDDVVLQQDELAVLTACSSRSSCDPMRSGLEVTTSDSVVCSSGFAADRAGNPVLIGSGHCGSSSTAGRYHGGVHFGNVTDSKVSGRVDAARFSVNFPFDTTPRIFVDNSEMSRKVSTESSWANLTIGENACNAGAATPGNCGEILAKNFSPSAIPSSERFVRAEYCSAEGDSGAGVYRNENALGIQSGKHANCSDLPSENPYGFFGSIEYAQSALNADLEFLP